LVFLLHVTSGAKNQQWRYEPNETFVCVNSGLVLDVNEANAEVIVNTFNANRATQRWKIQNNNTIVCKGNGHVLDVDYGSQLSCTKVIVYKAKNTANQQWTFYNAKEVKK